MSALREPRIYERVAFLPVGELRIDPSYQRRLQDSRVNKIAANWDDAKADTITVSARANGFYVLDGQHRLAGARKAGVQGLWALIHTGMSPHEEAALFVALNLERSNPKPIELFRSRLSYDAVAQDIRRVAEDQGWSIRLNKDLGEPKWTVGVSVLDRWYAFGGAPFLANIFRVAGSAWPDDRDNGRADVLDAIGAFLSFYEWHEGFDIKRLIRKLSEQSVTGFRQMMMSTTRGFAGSTRRAVGVDVILSIYNRSLRGNLLPQLSPMDRRALAEARKDGVRA